MPDGFGKENGKMAWDTNGYGSPMRMLLIFGIASMMACAGQTGQRATQGAVKGAAAGAAGSVVAALIFGGDVGDAAARGAAWGATTGAVSGAIAGSREDSAIKKREQDQAVQKLKQDIGEDAFAGLTALVKCKHPVALGYAETAQRHANNNYAAAGLWLEVLTNEDVGKREMNQDLLPKLINADPRVTSPAEVRAKVDTALAGLANIRRQHGLPVKCTP
jgi:hypothetical protein